MEHVANRKNLVFVVSSMGRGGAERVVSNLANYYAENGWKVYIIMLWHNIVKYQLRKSVTICDLSDENINVYLKIPSLIFKLRKIIKEISPLAVVSFVAQNSVLTGIAIKGLDVRFIPSERFDPSAVKRNAILRKAIAHTYKSSSLTVLQTKRAYNYFPKEVQKNSVVIYNPVSVKIIAQQNRKAEFVSAGRLEPEKNHKMLIKAFARFSKNHQKYTLTIYGDGSLRNELVELIGKLGMSDKVFLPGNVSDILNRESDAEAFILTSNREGMSNALMEAMALGLPCISTNCSGSDELIANGKNGLLIPVEDEDALVEAMSFLADNRNDAERMGRTAREFSKCFSIENVIEQWSSAIEGDYCKGITK